MSEETKKCPFCGEDILTAAVKCKHCQSMLNDRPATVAGQASPGSCSQQGNGAFDIPGINYGRTVCCFALVAIVIFFLGWIYIWSCSIPFVFWMMPAMYGGIAGGLMFLAIKNLRNEKIETFVFFGIIAALIACYAGWIWFVKDETQQFIMSPGELCDTIKDILSTRRIPVKTFVASKRVAFEVADGWLTLVWLAESAMIFGGVAMGIFVAYSESFFCPVCKQWSEEKTKPYKLASDKGEYELTSIEAIMQMHTPEENTDHYTVQVFECPFCKNGAFTLKKQKIVVKDGKYETEGKTLLRRMFCPADKIKELKKFVTTTGIKAKE